MNQTSLSIGALSMFVGALLICGIMAQDGRTTAARVSSQPVTTQTATTEAGRRVILKSDGTWQYAPVDSAVSATSHATPSAEGGANSTLFIEAGLVYKSGDVKPVARTTFHLLDTSLANILESAGLEAQDTLRDGVDERDYVSTYGLRTLYPDEEFYPKATEAISSHIVQSATTDFSGKAKFAPVPAGIYYVMAVHATARGFAAWNLKIELKDGENVLTLDQNNATVAL